jgi:hypothetical protein
MAALAQRGRRFNLDVEYFHNYVAVLKMYHAEIVELFKNTYLPDALTASQ